MQVLAWSSFALLLYAVKPFYGVIAGTFIMSFVGNSVVAMWERTAVRVQAWAAEQGYEVPRPPRKMLAAAYCLMMLTVLSIGSCITVPIVFDSWRYLKSVLLSDNPYVELANSMYSMLGPEATGRVESLLATLFGEPSRGALNSLSRVSDAPALSCQLQQSLKGYVAASRPFFNKILKGGSQVFAQVVSALIRHRPLLIAHVAPQSVALSLCPRRAVSILPRLLSFSLHPLSLSVHCPLFPGAPLPHLHPPRHRSAWSHV